jgi:protocatechuate 3,4-dioxygenase beta subunit
MSSSKNYSRREITKQIGVAAGLSLATRGFAMTGPATPAQVEGPFHPVHPNAETDTDLTLLAGHTQRATGETVLVRGIVRDTEGKPLFNALVDVWQANHHGRYSHSEDPNPAPLDPHFQGWGLMTTGREGNYGFKTIKPGPYPLKFLGEGGWRCQHIHFKVSCLGYQSLTTQMYFHGDPLIEQDLEIAKAPKVLRPLLIASSVPDEATGLPQYAFDVSLAPA